jgi:hypothetical protein
MATTLSAATLTVKITESILLNGSDQGATNTLSIGSINEVSKRIVSCPTSEIIILSFSTVSAAGTFIEADVRYIRITNKDDAHHVTLTFADEDSTEFALKLDKGQSFIYNADLEGGVVDTMHAGGSALTVELNDLVSITSIAHTAACDLEIFVASA